MDPLQTFIQFLQASISPVALISGVGLLLLTFTNRLGRVIDRTRQLVAELDKPDVPRREAKVNEIRILMKRGSFLKISIALITFSVIMSSLIIPMLIVMRATDLDLRILGNVLFSLSILAILVSAAYFFRDVMLSLTAIRLEAHEFQSDGKGLKTK